LGPDPKALGAACRLAVAVAVSGEQADPPLPAPSALKPILGFHRMSPASYELVRRVVDDDAVFRARVAEAAGDDAAALEQQVGRAGRLWLTRPEGWASDPVFADGSATSGGDGARRLKRARDGAEARAERYRQEAERADAARRTALRDLAEAREEAARAAADRVERDRLVAQVRALEEERNTAVRSLKATESDLAQARRDLRIARDAAREAETELLAARATGRPDIASAPSPTSRSGATPPRPTGKRAARTRRTVTSDQDEAARDFAAAMADLTAPEVSAGAREGRERPRRATSGRRAPELPPGMAADSAEAHRHLVTVSGALFVVDGYNLARTAWPELEPLEERRRTVALLEDLHARWGSPITVVFDGDDSVVSPAASRWIAVRYSGTGVTADDDIAALLRSLPAAQPTVVVSSDREVADDARRQGTAVIGAADFLAAAGR